MKAPRFSNFSGSDTLATPKKDIKWTFAKFRHGDPGCPPTYAYYRGKWLISKLDPEVAKWARANRTGRLEIKEGYGGLAMFWEHPRDAVMFKLMWCG